VNPYASSAYGTPRSTMDVDMVSDLRADHVRSLVKMLDASHYIDENMVLDAIERRSSFNIIHIETMLKIDIFVSKNTPYDIEAFKRRRKDSIDEDMKSLIFYLVSPEDIILNKLEWYRLGGGVSEDPLLPPVHLHLPGQSHGSGLPALHRRPRRQPVQRPLGPAQAPLPPRAGGH
jgi:hypothetical protein